LKKIRERKVIQHLARMSPRDGWRNFFEVLDKFQLMFNVIPGSTA
jgi:hypothetical protein